MEPRRRESPQRIGSTLISSLFLVLATIAFALFVASRFGSPLMPAELTHEEWVQESAAIGWSPAAESGHLAADLFQRVNDERVIRGLPPLAWDGTLAERAREWSEEMISTGFAHSPASFRSRLDFRAVGENVARGHMNTSQLHVDWMESAGHRVNIIEPGYSAIGIGVVCRNDGLMWATQMFGSPDGFLSLDEADPPPIEPLSRRDPGLGCGPLP